MIFGQRLITDLFLTCSFSGLDISRRFDADDFFYFPALCHMIFTQVCYQPEGRVLYVPYGCTAVRNIAIWSKGMYDIRAKIIKGSA